MTLEKNATFIIVNFNGSKDTNKCIDSIFLQHYDNNNININVIVVDNASDSEDIYSIKKHCENYSGVIFIESESNIGYFPAFNAAINSIYDKVVQREMHVVLCNNDLVFNNNFIATYFSNVYTKDTFVVSPNVIKTDGTHQNPHVLKKISMMRKFLYKLYFSNYIVAVLLRLVSSFLKNKSKININVKSQFIYMGIGACYILPPVFFDKYKNLDARTFLGGEEALLAAQIRSINGKIYFDKDLVVLHSDAVTFKKFPAKWRYLQSKKSYSVYKDLL